MSETSERIDNEYYDILNLGRDASFDDIKRSYRNLAIVYHPDRNPDSAENFIKLKEAYDVLSNPESREIYDSYGKNGLKVYEEYIQPVHKILRESYQKYIEIGSFVGFIVFGFLDWITGYPLESYLLGILVLLVFLLLFRRSPIIIILGIVVEIVLYFIIPTRLAEIISLTFCPSVILLFYNFITKGKRENFILFIIIGLMIKNTFFHGDISFPYISVHNTFFTIIFLIVYAGIRENYPIKVIYHSNIDLQFIFTTAFLYIRLFILDYYVSGYITICQLFFEFNFGILTLAAAAIIQYFTHSYFSTLTLTKIIMYILIPLNRLLSRERFSFLETIIVSIFIIPYLQSRIELFNVIDFSKGVMFVTLLGIYRNIIHLKNIYISSKHKI